MITINLLPKEMRKKEEKAKLVGFDVGKLYLAFFALIFVVIVLYLSMGMVIAKRGGRIADLEKEIARLYTDCKDVLAIEDEIKKLEGKSDALSKLMLRRLMWSKKLNEISDLLQDQVWLTYLSISKEIKTLKIEKRLNVGVRQEKPETVVVRHLNLKGIVVSISGEEMVDLVGKFMRKLEEDSDFFKDFNDIVLISTQRDKIGDRDIMKFEIKCRIKDGA